MTLRGYGVSARLILAGAVVAATVACSPIVRKHGFVPRDSELATLAVGSDTIATATERLGRPALDGLVTDRSLYYVESRFEQSGPFAPRETDREVVALTFDGAGRLANVERFGLERGQVVLLSRRVTDGLFADSTFLRQLFGNLGQVNAEQLFGGGQSAEP